MRTARSERGIVKVSRRVRRGAVLAAQLMLTLSISVAVNIRADESGVRYEANPSLINLIADPDRYDGKIIWTTGVARVEYEGFRIYLTKQDAKHHVFENSIVFDPTGARIDLERMRKLSGEYVQIGGRFVTRAHPDESGARLGAITEISMFRRL